MRNKYFFLLRYIRNMTVDDKVKAELSHMLYVITNKSESISEKTRSVYIDTLREAIKASFVDDVNKDAHIDESTEQGSDH